MWRLVFLIALMSSALSAGAVEPIRFTLCGPNADGSTIDQRIATACSHGKQEFEGINRIEISPSFKSRVELTAFNRLPLNDGSLGPIVSLANFRIVFGSESEAKEFVRSVTERQVTKIVGLVRTSSESAFVLSLTGTVSLKAKNVFIYRAKPTELGLHEISHTH